MLAVARMYNSSLGQIAGTTTNNCDHSVHRASIDCVCVCFRRAEVSANVGGKWKKKERKKERKKEEK